MEIVKKLIEQYKQWREHRWLKNRGFSNRAQYDRYHDPDYFSSASNVKDFYHGYSNYHVFRNHTHIVYHWDIAFDGIILLHKWCKKHCIDKFRVDVVRGFFDKDTDMLLLNNIGTDDYITVAFKDSKDYCWFVLNIDNLSNDYT